MSVGEYIAALLASEKLGAQVTCHKLFPPVEPCYAPTHLPWPAAISRALEQRGINGLYSHQALATDHIRAGHSIVAATPTASGKSLIYNLPVLDRYLRDRDARALYLFPLKALAQDQLGAFNALVEGWPKEARPTAALYDGDTTDHFRRKIRRNPPTVLISNPEMLHLGILPHHEQWAEFLAGLSHVVVDEAHTYRGVFGAHMAQVFRRLNRIAGRYGARPVYVLCTATVGNPGELAAALTGTDAPAAAPAIATVLDSPAQVPSSAPATRITDAPVVIDQSGAPQGGGSGQGESAAGAPGAGRLRVKHRTSPPSERSKTRGPRPKPSPDRHTSTGDNPPAPRGKARNPPRASTASPASVAARRVSARSASGGKSSSTARSSARHRLIRSPSFLLPKTPGRIGCFARILSHMYS